MSFQLIGKSNNMDKIRLTKNAKNILFAIQSNNYPNPIPRKDYEDINLLKQCGLVEIIDAETGFIILAQLSDHGKAYLHINPKLKNPSLWDDKKYLITTSISLLALILSIISILK